MSGLRQQARILEAANDDLALRPVRETIDWDALNRVAAFAAERRAELGEARWAELQAEWEA